MRNPWNRALRALACGAVCVTVFGVSAASAGIAPDPTDPAAPDGERALAAISSGAVRLSGDANGRVHYLTTSHGYPLAAASVRSAGVEPATAARAHLADFARVFGVTDVADLETGATDPLGEFKVVRFRQTHGGLPVIGGELAVTVDAAGSLVAINGETGAVDGVTTTAKVSAATAASHAIISTAKAKKIAKARLRASAPVLSVYDPSLIGPGDGLGSRVVWKLEVTAADRADINQYVLVDARDGHMALTFSQIQHATPPDRRVCDFNNVPNPDNTCTPALATRVEGDPATGIADVDDAYELTGAVHLFYQSLGRDGIDNAGMPLISTVRFCPFTCPYENAFWDGQQMTFGEGFASADDVVGHELTHGVTQFTSGLLYYYQSGAINESMSDVMGELFDQSYAGPPAGDDSPAARWQLGEDLPPSIGVIRDMEDPPAFGQPDSMTSPLWDPFWFDNGGVHQNSGVGNKAAFLMRDGGTFNGITVAPITDPVKVAKIWLGADRLLTAGADYADLAYALQQSCQNLGYTSECSSVDRAVLAVKMTTAPAAEAAIPQAAVCATKPFVPTNLFFDTFNRTAGGSLGSSWTPSPGAFASIDGGARPSVASGNALSMATPFFDPGLNDTVTTTNWITLPGSSTAYLHFHHLDAFDWIIHPVFGNVYFDGGFVEIDVEGDGKSWLSLSSWSNGPDKILDGTSGPKAFSGDSRGWTSSRASLSSYTGKRIKLRFRVLTDGVPADSAGYGWWLDNVRVYTCTKKNPLSIDYNGDGFGDTAVGSPHRDVGNLADVGAVDVMYGASTGLPRTTTAFLAPRIGGAPGPPAANKLFGTATASADFNGDGYADLAVGAPANDGTTGTVSVLYGSFEGITGKSAKLFAATDIALGGCCDVGVAVAAGDFNGDGYADLAVGADGAHLARGGIRMLLGGSAGLSTTGSVFFNQETSGVAGTGEAGDRFGASLTTGDFNGDGLSDLAIGVPHKRNGLAGNAGEIVVLPGSASSGLTGTGARVFSQNSTNVPDTAEADDLFGAALAAGDVNNDGRADLAVGAPGEAFGAAVSAGGTVTLLRGSSSGLTATASQAVSQDATNVPDSAETGDQFGAAVSIGDFNGDGFGDLAVGSPGETAFGATAAGAVTVLPGTASGVTGTGSKRWSQGPTSAGDSLEAGDLFGTAVRAVRLRSSSRADLVIGVPGENTGSGAIHVLPGSPTGLIATGSQVLTASQVAGRSQNGAAFGEWIG